LEKTCEDRIAKLQRENARLNKVISEKDKFLATVSHEVRSPMNGVFGMADALSRTSLDEKQRRYLTVLRNACDSMLLIANQLLDKGKLGSGQTTLVPVDFDLSEFVSGQVAEFSARAEKKGLILELDTKFLTDSRIRFDRVRLGQVLNNLISNAIRYTDEGRVVVRAILQASSEDKRHLIISVEDSGIGIAADKHNLVFEAFSSADPVESANRGGTGLGLNVVQELVALMKGSIRLDSTAGLGSTFTVELVVQPAKGDEQPDTPARRPMPKSLNVLLAEDNDSNAFVFEVLLEDTGVNTTRVRNGQEAVMAFERTQFDVVFMDIQMPVMNGIQATAAIRELQKGKKHPVPVIALSADTVASQCHEYKAAGFTDSILKPMRQRDLLDMLSIFDKNID